MDTSHIKLCGLPYNDRPTEDGSVITRPMTVHIFCTWNAILGYYVISEMVLCFWHVELSVTAHHTNGTKGLASY
jgi:hypothetical protein